jgi:hypothetical protein
MNAVNYEGNEMKTVFCTNCGKSMPAGHRFCTACGNKLWIPETPPERMQYQEHDAAQYEEEPPGEPPEEQVAATWQPEPEDIVYDPRSAEMPLVGWLVAVRGEYRGQGFELKSGQNYIGRAENMSIALIDEATVSQYRHAVIIFEPVEKAFYIMQGESNGLTYLNGETVMEPKPLNAHDKIRLGAAEFVFMPFCSDKFSWGDY